MFGFPKKSPPTPPPPPPWQAEGFTREEFYTPPLTTITITVRQVKASELWKYCKAGQGCFDRDRMLITVPRILHDYDEQGFARLGHEVWHALGGRH